MKTYGEIIGKEWDEMSEIEKNLNEIPLFTKEEFHDKFVKNDCYVWVSSKEGCDLMCQMLDKFGYLNYSKKTKRKDKSYLNTDFWSLSMDGILVFCPEIGVVMRSSDCLNIWDKYDRHSQVCKVRVLDDDSSFPVYYNRFLNADKFGVDEKTLFERHKEKIKKEINRMNKIKRSIRNSFLVDEESDVDEYKFLVQQISKEDKEIEPIIQHLTECRNRNEEPMINYDNEVIKKYIDGEIIEDDVLFDACVRYYLRY